MTHEHTCRLCGRKFDCERACPPYMVIACPPCKTAEIEQLKSEGR